MRTLNDFRRHVQDGPNDCGRACAQMVIAYVNRASYLPDRPLPTQESLRLLESTPDDGNDPATWATSPDELVALLNRFAAQSEWRIVKGHQAYVLAEACARLENDVPALVTTGETDHWNVVVGVASSGGGTAVSLVDPREIVRGDKSGPHTYRDACHESGTRVAIGVPFEWWRPDQQQHLVARVAPHAGEALGVVCGTAAQEKVDALFPQFLESQPTTLTLAPSTDASEQRLAGAAGTRVRGLLDKAVARFRLTRLRQFLAAADRSPGGLTAVHVRLVYPFSAGGVPFVICGLLTEHGAGGLLVGLTASEDPELLFATDVSNPKAVTSLGAHKNERLLWGVPGAQSGPEFPWVETGSGTFERLVDGATVTQPV